MAASLLLSPAYGAETVHKTGGKTPPPPAAEPPFDPKGKTEEEITAKWGAPKGRMEFGDEVHLMFDKGTVIISNGKATKFDAENPQKASASKAEENPRSSAPAPSVSTTEQSRKNQQNFQSEQEVYVKRLETDLEEKQKELSEKENSGEKNEILEKYEVAKDRAWQNHYGSGNYSVLLRNAEKDKDDAIAQLEERQGLKRLREEIKGLQEDIREQRKKLYE